MLGKRWHAYYFYVAGIAIPHELSLLAGALWPLNWPAIVTFLLESRSTMSAHHYDHRRCRNVTHAEGFANTSSSELQPIPRHASIWRLLFDVEKNFATRKQPSFLFINSPLDPTVVSKFRCWITWHTDFCWHQSRSNLRLLSGWFTTCYRNNVFTIAAVNGKLYVLLRAPIQFNESLSKH